MGPGETNGRPCNGCGGLARPGGPPRGRKISAGQMYRSVRFPNRPSRMLKPGNRKRPKLGPLPRPRRLPGFRRNPRPFTCAAFSAASPCVDALRRYPLPGEPVFPEHAHGFCACEEPRLQQIVFFSSVAEQIAQREVRHYAIPPASQGIALQSLQSRPAARKYFFGPYEVSEFLPCLSRLRHLVLCRMPSRCPFSRP